MPGKLLCSLLGSEVSVAHFSRALWDWVIVTSFDERALICLCPLNVK